MDATYQYDALTRRVVTADAAETRHFYFNNQWRAVEERVSGAVKAQYVWNPADRWDLIRRRRSVAGTLDETRFVLRDYLDPAAIINPGGVVTERYRYDAFGPATVLAPDFSVRAASECGWNFLYHAEFIDALTGLYNYGFRFYHPNLGRWISRDPIGEDGGLNLFGFVGNCPVEMIDELGLWNPAGHNHIIDNAFGNTLDPRDVQALKDASYNADTEKDAQLPCNSYKHAMSERGRDPRAEQKRYEKFLKDQMSSAVKLERRHRHKEAMEALGRGMHAIADSVSPAHRGNQEWDGSDGFCNKCKLLYHILRELFPTPRQTESASKGIKNYYDEFKRKASRK